MIPTVSWAQPIARSKGESKYPELWPDFAMIPALGVTGDTLQSLQHYTASRYNASYPFTWNQTPKGWAARIDGIYEAFKLNAGFDVPAGSDFSDFFLIGEQNVGGGANPGFWRDGATSQGSNFHAYNSSSSDRVWVYWNGVTILQPASGNGLPNDDELHSFGISVVSEDSVAAYIDGVQEQSASHATATAAFTINNFGFQWDTYNIRIENDYIMVLFYLRALTAGDYARLHGDPYCFLQRRPFMLSYGEEEPPEAGLFMIQRNLSGLGVGGPFFENPLG